MYSTCVSCVCGVESSEEIMPLSTRTWFFQRVNRFRNLSKQGAVAHLLSLFTPCGEKSEAARHELNYFPTFANFLFFYARALD